MKHTLYALYFRDEIWLSRMAVDDLQADFPDYLGAVGPMSPAEAVAYLDSGYPELPPTADLVNAFLGSSEVAIVVDRLATRGGRLEAL